MRRSGYWIRRAKIIARQQRQLYGLKIPDVVSALFHQEEPHLSVAGILQVIIFVVFGPPRARLHLFWHHLADRDTPARLRKIESLARDLRGRLSDQCRVATGAFERQYFSRDLARVPRLLEKLLYRTSPLIVVQPKEEGDVVTALAFARERWIPVYPRGVSSSAFGGTVPTRNGFVLDFSSMMRILDIDPVGLTARVQPGVRWADLAGRLGREGLACVTTPSSRFSTVGGWASTGGFGIDGFSYGHFSQSIVGARIALMNGSVLQLKGGDSELRDFLGTEGQLGIFTELTVKIRPKPAFSRPRLVYFENANAALAFMDRMIAADHRPSHLVFYDCERMAEENRLFYDRTGRDQAIVEERDAVLLHFEEANLETKFMKWNSAEMDRGPGARYLWMERFFPLKAQRLGSGLLAGEVMLPRESVPEFIRRVQRIAAFFGIKPAIEAIVSRPADDKTACVVIASFPCDPTRIWNYLLRMILVQMLVYQGVRLGGHPYGLGIWNAPFLPACYSSEERRRLLNRKQELASNRLLNPHKFFSINTRFFNLPGLIFRPRIFRGALGTACIFSRFIGAMAKFGGPVQHSRWNVPLPEGQSGIQLLSEAVLRCTSCGACVSACPAYLLTGDELVTGRSKLRMAEMRIAEIHAGEAHRIYQCLHCGLCEEVCQTRLPLRDCYLILEKLVEKQHGYPNELIQGFIQRLDANRGLIRVTFGLDLPDWFPDGSVPDLQTIQLLKEASA